LVSADRIVIKFAPEANILGAAPLHTLAERNKITPKTRDLAFKLLRNISKTIAKATPSDIEIGQVTLEMTCSSKNLTVVVVLENHGSLTLSAAKQIQNLHHSISVKPARRKVSFELPSHL